VNRVLEPYFKKIFVNLETTVIAIIMPTVVEKR
jgi:hypothetical protein